MHRLGCSILALLGFGTLPGVCRDYPLMQMQRIMPEHYVAYRSATELHIDGHLDEPAWQRSEWTGAFVDISGDGTEVPRYLTRAKMLWDDEYFYVAADLEEPHVWATLSRRDATIYRDNDFEVFIDPDGDTHLYYEFEINALGTEWDLLLVRPYRDGGPYMSAWDIQGLKTAVSVWGTLNDPKDKDEGWSVEMAFPWRVLKEGISGGLSAPPADGDVWRVNFSRVQWSLQEGPNGYMKVEGADEDNWVWSAQGVVNMHVPEMWGFVLFVEDVAGKGRRVFSEPPGEPAKRVLRSIYYRQKIFRREHGHYTSSLDSLGLEYGNLSHFLWPPKVSVTEESFEAWLEEVIDLENDGGIDRFYIRQDSRTWKDRAKP